MATELLFSPGIYSVDAQSLYKVAVTVQDRGDLPDNGIFVYQIIDNGAPSQDRYVRVASVSDYVDIPRDRVSSINTGGRYYRSSTFTKEYENVRVADVAQGLVKGYVNELVEQYAIYLTDFNTSSVVPFPLVTDSLVESLKAEYETSLLNVSLQEAVITAKKDECTALSSTLSSLISERDSLQLTSDALSGLRGFMTLAVTDWNALLMSSELLTDSVESATVAVTADRVTGEVKTTATATLSLLWDPDPTSIGETGEGILPGLLRDFSTARARVTATVAGLNTKARLVDAQILTINTRLDILISFSVPSATTALGTCQEEEAAATQSLATMKVARDAALAAVFVVCPTYVPPV